MCLLKKPEFMSDENWDKLSKLNIESKSALASLSDILEKKVPMQRNAVVQSVNNHRSKNKYYKKLYLSKLRNILVTVEVYEHKSPLTTFTNLFGKITPDAEPEFSMRMCAPRPQLKSDYRIPPDYVPSYNSAWLVARCQMMTPPDMDFEEINHSKRLDDETIRIHPCDPDDTSDIFEFIKTNTFKITGGDK